MRSFFILLNLCCFWAVNVMSANNVVPSLGGVEITLTGDFDIPDGLGNNHRSIPSVIPFSAFLNDDHSIDLDFYQPIGEIEIVISQGGITVYSSFENIKSSQFKKIQLPHSLFGNCLLEIVANNGSYIYGCFDL